LQGNLKRILISEESKTFKQLQVYLCLIGYKQGYFLSINAGRFTIGIHPQSLLGINGIDKNLRQQISERIKGYESLTVFYISRIVEGVGSIAAVVNPQPIFVRSNDFKCNDYAQLLGGQLYESAEENPMIVYRGACRCPSHEFHDGFVLECNAIK